MTYKLKKQNPFRVKFEDPSYAFFLYEAYIFVLHFPVQQTSRFCFSHGLSEIDFNT